MRNPGTPHPSTCARCGAESYRFREPPSTDQPESETYIHMFHATYWGIGGYFQHEQPMCRQCYMNLVDIMTKAGYRVSTFYRWMD